MASENRIRRFTAEQAIQLFRKLEQDNEEDMLSSDSDDSEDDNNDSLVCGMANSSDSDLPNNETDSDFDNSPAVKRRALPQPVLSRYCSKRAKDTVIATENATVSEWKSVSVEDMPRTTAAFDFLPRNRRTPGVNADLTDQSTALDCFCTLFDDEVNDLLISSINEYATVQVQKNAPALKRSRFRQWNPITKYDLMKFIAITMAMGLDKRPSIRDYFSSHMIFQAPFYGQMFSRDSFQTLYSTMLHVGQPDAEGKDKIEPFCDMLVSKFNNAFTPFENLSIDEMIVGWKGRWKYKQYNATKPHKYHIKSFGLTDSSTGFVLNILTYYGADTSYDPSAEDTAHAIKIFTTLLKPIGTGYHIYADRWYTTRVLVDDLLSKELYFTGTLQTNRVGFPPELKSLSLKHMESRYWINHDSSILCLAWKDKKAKKPVIIVSSNAEAGDMIKRDKTKPAVINRYNLYMNGCDRADQAVGYYGLQSRKSRKWWKKLFFWLMEIVTINAHRLFVMTRSENTKNTISIKAFKMELINQLVAATSTHLPQTIPTRAQGGRPKLPANAIQRLEYTKHMIVYTTEDRNCQVCSTPAKRKRSNFVCEGCDGRPHLHPKDCFKIWHTKPDLAT